MALPLAGLSGRDGLDGEDNAGNALGVKGLGEVVQVGVAAAIGNAVFNATGRRVRQLPISAETLL
ncbi:hypothetical protein [Streptomyces albicerus]|uniref:hypothetical protein n=1 Tax=Streptomyces albicerus TaxID=2569859 RepID=UPI00124B1DDD|nr:hypothetical protein [Streptomyces albicerus]